MKKHLLGIANGKDKICISTREEDFEKFKNGYVINFGMSNMFTLERRVKILNDFLLVLKEKGNIDKNILELIEFIIENINNIAYFQLKYIDNYYIKNTKEKIDNFKYKEIENLNLKRISSINKLKELDFKEGEKLKLDNKFPAGYYIAKEVEVEEDYRDANIYIINKGITFDSIYAIVENDDINSIVEVYKDILYQINNFDKSNFVKSNLEYKYWSNLEIAPNNIPLELLHVLIFLFNKLIYILNSTSFRNNELYSFDEFEVNQEKIKCYFKNSLDFLTNIVNNEIAKE